MKFATNWNFVTITSCLLASIIIQGCQSYHMHRVSNISDFDLYNVTVKNKGREINHGVVIPQSWKSYSGSFALNRNDEIELSWHGKGGSKTKKILLEESPYSREVVFNIDGENVTITFQSY